MAYMDYIRTDILPTTYCKGCGNGIQMQSVFRALDKLGIPPEKVVVCTGVGCFATTDRYFKTNAYHGPHGRVPAAATAIKLCHPELTVICMLGDGDGATIGGNHLIHAARRNVDITCIISNNLNYGMTGGQYSATTPEGRHLRIRACRAGL